MNNHLLAKSKPKETIKEHTACLKDNFNLIKKLYPDLQVDWELLKLALTFHDLGKINTKFQNKLYKLLNIPQLPDHFQEEPEIPHGNFSAAFFDRKKLLEEFDEISLNILYQSVYFHHPRAINENQKEYFKNSLKEDVQTYLSALPPDIPYLTTTLLYDFSRYIKNRIDYNVYEIDSRATFRRYVMVKGLLNRLDYAASAHLEVETPNTNLEALTLSFLQAKGGLRDIQQYLLSQQKQNHVIVASTGIGKTEAGLLWIGNQKGFFTLPLRVSINAIYKRIKEQDIHFDQTALLHSDALAFLIKNTPDLDSFDEYTRARQLSMPLTITTIDQLFKIVFKAEGFESILATLAYSKVIIDEIQMYSPQLIACIIMGLKYITMMGGQFTILTATFPEVLEHFMRQNHLTYFYQEFLLQRQRHKILLLDQAITEAIPEIFQKGLQTKVLVIVNTVKKAQEIFAQLGDIPHKYLLHSRFIKKDRFRLEKEIMDFSNSQQTGIWVTTQIVEASLDIDFDYLFTELSTVDGLFQRMGRCYRKRDFTDAKKEANVRVYYQKVSGIGKIIDTEIFNLSKHALLKFHNHPITEHEKLAVVKEVYALETIKPTQYYRAIKQSLQDLQDIPAYQMKRDEIEEKFRNIQSFTVIPLQVFQEHHQQIASWIEELSQTDTSTDPQTAQKQKIRKIQLYEQIKDLTVDVPYYMKKYLRDLITINQKQQFQIIDLQYSSQTGLGNKEGEDNIL